MQETQVWSLIQEDPTCQGATVCAPHYYWACALEAGSTHRAPPRLPRTTCPRSQLWSKRRAHSEKPHPAARAQPQPLAREEACTATKTHQCQNQTNRIFKIYINMKKSRSNWIGKLAKVTSTHSRTRDVSCKTGNPPITSVPKWVTYDEKVVPFVRMGLHSIWASQQYRF